MVQCKQNAIIVIINKILQNVLHILFFVFAKCPATKKGPKFQEILNLKLTDNTNSPMTKIFTQCN